MPNLYFQVVDVRDCARIHVDAACGDVAHLERVERIAVASSVVINAQQVNGANDFFSFLVNLFPS